MPELPIFAVGVELDVALGVNPERVFSTAGRWSGVSLLSPEELLSACAELPRDVTDLRWLSTSFTMSARRSILLKFFKSKEKSARMDGGGPPSAAMSVLTLDVLHVRVVKRFLRRYPFGWVKLQ